MNGRKRLASWIGAVLLVGASAQVAAPELIERLTAANKAHTVYMIRPAVKGSLLVHDWRVNLARPMTAADAISSVWRPLGIATRDIRKGETINAKSGAISFQGHLGG